MGLQTTLNGTADQARRAQVTVLTPNSQLLSSMTVLRDTNTDSRGFYAAFTKVAGQLMVAALDHIPTEKVDITTPTGSIYHGVAQVQEICGVSILRAGASMEEALRGSYNGPLCFGKVLIQRDEATCLPVQFYSKFPKDVQSKFVLILEPMLATGGSAIKAIEMVLDAGVPECRIVFVNLVSSQAGLDTLVTRFPQLKVVTAAVDPDLTMFNHVDPGLGDFGDRFYGT